MHRLTVGETASQWNESVHESAAQAASAYARMKGFYSPQSSPGHSPTRSKGKLSPMRSRHGSSSKGAKRVSVEEAIETGKRWAAAVELQSAASVNAQIKKDGGPTQTILLAEAWHDGQIVDVAHAIQAKREATKNAPTPLSLVLIAGPSSSGKTTFCSKLSMHLRCAGIKPETLSTDDYFLAREDPRHPRDKDGNLNFETLLAVDVDKLNADLQKLFTGKPVDTPIFNFVIGAPEPYKTRRKQLAPGGMLIMEGIFCLNPALTAQVDDASKFNVFIAPLSPLTLMDGSTAREDHVRLIRRISRDYLHRGNSALHTLKKYASVREGELENIYPFAGEAEVVYNSSLLYEMNVLKRTVGPLLHAITKAEAGALYGLAAQMLTFLENFEEVADSAVPNTSVLMEFIGKSIFE